MLKKSTRSISLFTTSSEDTSWMSSHSGKTNILFGFGTRRNLTISTSENSVMIHKAHTQTNKISPHVRHILPKMLVQKICRHGIVRNWESEFCWKKGVLTQTHLLFSRAAQMFKKNQQLSGKEPSGYYTGCEINFLGLGRMGPTEQKKNLGRKAKFWG